MYKEASKQLTLFVYAVFRFRQLLIYLFMFGLKYPN
jgi:hypothetical protein